MDTTPPHASAKPACRPRKRWTEEEDRLLLAAMKAFPHGNYSWKTIAANIPDRTTKDCRKRWVSGLNGSLRKGCWSAAEDEVLRKSVYEHGHDWAKISIIVGHRSGDQCSKRWKEVLDPTIKREAWSEEEDNKLLYLYYNLGTSWNKIATYFDGRRALSCRNRACKLLVAQDRPKPGTKKAEQVRLAMLAERMTSNEVPLYSPLANNEQKLSARTTAVSSSFAHASGEETVSECTPSDDLDQFIKSCVGDDGTLPLFDFTWTPPETTMAFEMEPTVNDLHVEPATPTRYLRLADTQVHGATPRSMRTVAADELSSSDYINSIWATGDKDAEQVLSPPLSEASGPLDDNSDGDTIMEASEKSNGVVKTLGRGFAEADLLITESPEQQPGSHQETEVQQEASSAKEEAPSEKEGAVTFNARRSTLATMDSSSHHFRALMHLAGDPAFVLRRIQQQQQQQQQQQGSPEPEQGDNTLRRQSCSSAVPRRGPLALDANLFDKEPLTSAPSHLDGASHRLSCYAASTLSEECLSYPSLSSSSSASSSSSVSHSPALVPALSGDGHGTRSRSSSSSGGGSKDSMALTLALVAASIARTAASLAKLYDSASSSLIVGEGVASNALSGEIMRQMQDMHVLGLGGEGLSGEETWG